MKMADIDNRVSLGVLLTMSVATLMLVMTHATPALATVDPTAASFRWKSHKFSLNENSAGNTVVGTVATTDPDGDSLTYSVSGTDAAKFNEVFAQNTSTGEITVKPDASIDHESKESYTVTVMATDGEDDSGVAQTEPTPDATTLAIIRIVDVDEPGILTLSTSSPRVGVEVRATLFEPDGRVGGIYSSVWATGHKATGPFVPFKYDRKWTHTPQEANQYKYLKLTVYYLDRFCPRVYSANHRSCFKKAEVVSDNAVEDADGLIVLTQVTNSPATGDIFTKNWSRLEVRHELSARLRNVRDEDGVESLYSNQTFIWWQWYRIDPVTGTEKKVYGVNHYGYSPWSYVITNADRGKGLQPQASFQDDRGNWEKLRGEIKSIPAPPNNAATGSPVITGTAQLGETLSADTSGISDADGITTSTLTYQWFADDGTDDTAIEDAVSSTYTLVADDVGKTITVQVVFRDEFGYFEVLTSAPTAAVTVRTQSSKSNNAATGAPTISGTARVGETLTASTTGISDADGLSKATFGYQWLADDTDISDATSSSYTLVATDEGKAIKVRVSFTDGASNAESLTSEATAAVAAAQPPLTATYHNSPESHDGNAGFTFELRFSEAPASGFSYTAVRDHALTITEGSVSNVRRLESGKNVRWEITVTPDADADVTIAVNATTDCTAQGAICNADGGKLSGGLKLVVPGPQENSAATGAPAISGTARVGETLTASTAGISDADGLANATFGYQWLADDTDISGATDSSYTLVAAHPGKVITVRITFTDDAGNAETLTSAATAAVTLPLLTASLENSPESHDGNAAFTFELRFSEEPASGFSYKTLRDHAFTVTGGSVSNVRRLEPPGNVRWEITVTPDSSADVTIVLPITTDCDAEGAVCAGDGRPLSNRLELTVPGPSG